MTKHYIAITCAFVLGAMLGFFYQGYRIYAGMYEQDKMMLQQLPVTGVKK